MDHEADLTKDANDSGADGEAGVASRGGRRWKRVAVAVPVTLAVLVGAAYVATSVADVPPPHQLAKIATAKPSEWGELFPYRTVEASAPRPLVAAEADLPAHVPWKGDEVDFADFLDTSHTNSFVVLPRPSRCCATSPGT